MEVGELFTALVACLLQLACLFAFFFLSWSVLSAIGWATSSMTEQANYQAGRKQQRGRKGSSQTYMVCRTMKNRNQWVPFPMRNFIVTNSDYSGVVKSGQLDNRKVLHLNSPHFPKHPLCKIMGRFLVTKEPQQLSYLDKQHIRGTEWQQLTMWTE